MREKYKLKLGMVSCAPNSTVVDVTYLTKVYLELDM